MIALLEARKAGLFGAGHILNNVVAGVVVGIVALPLAMAFAIASGAKPEQGLYTAIVAGLLTSALGGTRLQIAGPTGAFIVILAGITARHGIGGLQVATLMAGFILMAMGAARLGTVIKFIPDPVIAGFTAGIGIIIWVGQWQDFFGLKPTSTGEHFHQKLIQLLLAFPGLHLPTVALALAALAILLLAPRGPCWLRRVPAPLLAMVAVTTVQALCKLDGVATIGSAFGGIPQSLPTFAVPQVSVADALALIGPAFTIALLGAIESLLCAVVADGMAGTRHDANQELIGQGIANICSPLFGGFAATGAIARTAANIRNGASSPLAGIVHALTLLAVILALAPLAAYVPLCALSAILFVVAWNMSELPRVVRFVRTAPAPDVAVLLITLVLTVFADLVVAVNVGIVLAALLFMRRMSQTVEIEDETARLNAGNEAPHEAINNPAGQAAGRLPPDTLVYAINGPYFFAVAERLERTLESLQQRVGTVVLRLGRVPIIDATGMRSLKRLIDDFHETGTRVVLCEMRPNVAAKLARAGVTEMPGGSEVHRTLEDFLATARCSATPATAALSRPAAPP